MALVFVAIPLLFSINSFVFFLSLFFLLVVIVTMPCYLWLNNEKRCPYVFVHNCVFHGLLFIFFFFFSFFCYLIQFSCHHSMFVCVVCSVLCAFVFLNCLITNFSCRMQNNVQSGSAQTFHHCH